MSKYQSTSFSDVFSHQTKVGVVRGGQTPEFELSLKTGAEILKRLQNKHAYKVVDVLIDRDGIWHVDGREINEKFLADYIDLAWLTIHGDNGSIQHHLETLKIPYLGSDPVTADLTFNRARLKQRIKDLGLQTPDHIQLENVYTGDMEEDMRERHIEEKAFEVFGKLPGPWVVKPVAFSARFHTYLAKTFPELLTALRIISLDVDDVLVEEYIQGREFVSSAIPEFRGKEKYIIPPHEVRHGKEMFTHHTSRTGSFEMIPAIQISPKIKQLIEELTHELHNDFNLDDTAVFHFIMSPKGLYVISVQDNPELHEQAPLYRGLEYTGSSPDEFIFSRVARLLKRKEQ